jgi:hypothetical protein
MPRLPAGLLAVVLSSVALTAVAAPPNITRISPPALRVGQPTTLIIEGSGLVPEPRLLSSIAIASQSVKGKPAGNRLEIEVTLDASVPPGIYMLRLATANGISDAAAIAVDALPTAPFAAQINELPLAYHGNLPGPQLQRAAFTGKKGQRIVLDVEAQRLGSKLRPVVRLYDPKGSQIAWSPPRIQLAGDARCEVTLPQDGAYQIELHDQLYRAPEPAFYRLKVGALDYADFALPLAITAGTKGTFTLLGSNLKTTSELDGTTLARIPTDALVPWPAAPLATGSRPRAGVSDFAEIAEAPQADGKLQELPAAPVGISGLLAKNAEEDKFVLPVTPGQKLRFDVEARRANSPLDASLSIRNEQGGQLAAGDDRPGSADPLVDFTVPEKVTKLVVAIRDLPNRGGEDYVYRIAIYDAARPDVELSAALEQINIPAGGTLLAPVQIARTNFNGPLELEIPGLPPHIQLSGHQVPAGSSQALLALTATQGAPFAGLVRIIAKSADPAQPLARYLRSKNVPGAAYQPALGEEFGLAVSEAAPLAVSWNFDAAAPVFQGGKLAAPVEVTRAAGMAGPVRLKLVTTQPMPKKKVKQNNQDKEVDDVDRALRLEGMPVLAADAASLAVNVLIPGDLPTQPWDLSLVAELLSADQKKVLATVATPVRRITPQRPFTIELTSANAAEGKAGLGDAGKFAGKVVRAPGFTAPVTITLDGLPKEVSSPKAVVPGDKAEFELPLRFPFGSKPGELKNAKLVALLDGAATRSNEVAVSVKLTAGEKPPAEMPLEIFEDNESFLTALTEGGGAASLDLDKFSGKSSIKVAPPQRFNQSLPGLQVKIRENPGPGEYRYLRFAWKKQGGNTVVLQLNHDGMWGPGGSGRPGAKFRYHAGPGGEQFGGSLEVDKTLPAKFTVVTRDLFADFGEFTLNGIALTPADGKFAWFDHIYLGQSLDDFGLIKKE